jgi:putative FmdB family regulatory protein
VPLYAFACGRCGPFEAFRPVQEAAAAAVCPGCGAPARRRYTPPGIALMARPLRHARDREERSAHEPEVVGRKAGRPLPHRHGHGGAAQPWTMTH